ncbi:vesicle transport protein SFT2C [Bufo gargarizans]|uniref:vesicle transport protein SFT2C n=1 Tax=Bufo gargarizans TaxID=30331 RepID=UPI001CF5E839|nr:vesicle transport protein SFT2C [Bufo gargarizans]
MADLGRQLQEYVAQNKAGGSGSSAASSPGERQSSEPGWRAWFSPPSGGLSWSWSALDPDPFLPGMSGTQRLMAAALCAAMAALCFGLAALYVPLLLLRARKFAMLWSMGSVLGLGSVSLLRGPSRLLREPDPWTFFYLVALGGTLYAALGFRSTPLTLLGAVVQVITGAALLLGMLPGGAAGRRYISGLCGSLMRKGVSKALPV